MKLYDLQDTDGQWLPMRHLWAKFLFWALRVRWVVNELGEFGVAVMGETGYYYKHAEPLIYVRVGWRPVMRREFNEVIKRPKLPEGERGYPLPAAKMTGED